MTKIGHGFYIGANRRLYFDVHEFLATHNLTDTPEQRKAVWKQVKEDFGVIGITDLADG